MRGLQDVRRLFAVAALLAIGGCDGSPTPAPEPAPAPPPVPTSTVSVSLPAAAASAVASMATTAGDQGTGSTLNMAVLPSGSEALVLAADAQNHLMAAGVMTGTGSATNLSLDATSTSEFLVRAALGGFHAGTPTTSTAKATIDATADFPALVTAVTQALSNGVAPLQDQTVLSELGLVASEASTSFHAQVQSAARVRAASFPRVSATPYYFLNTANLGGTLLWLDDASSGVKLSNDTRVQWDAYLKAMDTGGQLSSGVLNATSFNPFTGVESPNSVTLNTSEPDTFEVHIEQGSTTQAVNMLNMAMNDVWAFVDIALFGVGLTPDALEACTTTVAKTFLGPNLTPIITAPDPKAYFNNLVQTGSIWDGVTACALPVGTKSSPFLKTIAEAFAYDLIFAVSVTQAYVVTDQTLSYLTTTFDAQVCKQGGVLVACPQSLTLTPSSASIGVGQTTTFTPSATTAAGLSTPVPSDLAWDSDDESIATVDDGVATGVAVGMTKITASSAKYAIAASAPLAVAYTPQVHIDITVNHLGGAPMAFFARVTPGSDAPAGLPTPSQTLTFQSSRSGTLCIATLDALGQGTCNAVFSGLPATITANYSGDSNWASASSFVVVNQIPKEYTN